MKRYGLPQLCFLNFNRKDFFSFQCFFIARKDIISIYQSIQFNNLNIFTRKLDFHAMPMP